MRTSKYAVAIVILCVIGVQAWYTCNERPFCDAIRNNPPPKNRYHIVNPLNGMYIYDATLKKDVTGQQVMIRISSIENDNFRIQIGENNRPDLEEALDDRQPKLVAFTSANETTLVNGGSTLKITASPQFQLELTTNDGVNVIINEQNYLTYNDDDNLQSIAIDLRFNNVQAAYGLPEHADNLQLKDTKNSNPYRMYNVDYMSYKVGTQEALYGAIPLLYAHGNKSTSGLFWLNAAQTFVDIDWQDGTSLNTLIIAEGGKIDLFLLSGPTMQQVARQYVHLTGKTPLPQLFTLGYHQCRYSYLTQDDLESVVDNLDAGDFPMDVMWLDIDYTDGKRYFTWNYTAFPNPLQMQDKLAKDGRKLVLILDPHIKVEDDYFVYAEGKEKYFVRNPDGSDYQAQSWPGLSSYIDFYNPKARDWYSMLYSYDKFANTSSVVHIWNDMNEPSVFQQDEQTMSGDLLHHDNVKHRDLHNIYGFLQTKATFNGLSWRFNGKQRPFVLTRSHFAGSQRYSAVWSGDIAATWEHIKISIPMALTEALAGVSFSGTDVGGFALLNPDPNLYQRWFQLGAWLPFFRQHSPNDGPRREPYLYPEDMQTRFRAAIKQRYLYLPYWYTIFYEHERNGDPVIRPLVYNYPHDEVTYNIDEEFLVGDNILVAPVVTRAAINHTVYIPGTNEWSSEGNGWIWMAVNMDSVPVYHRRGSIIPLKPYSRKSSHYMHDDPYDLLIHLNQRGEATGRLYVDDYESYDYRKKKSYSYIEFNYADGKLTSQQVDEDAHYDKEILIEALIIHPYENEIAKSACKYQLDESDDGLYFTVRNVNIHAEGDRTATSLFM